MFHPIESYFKFLWRSTNQHGVHSPFVFDLVTRCLYDKTKHPEYQILKNYRDLLLQNHNTIEVTDFGAGSKIFKSNQRPISKIARTAGITAKNAALLFRLAAYVKPESILEIGTSLGLATSALSLGHRSAKITTLEGCPQTSKVAQQQFRNFGLKNIESVVTDFDSHLQNLNRQPRALDFIYFDGNHQKDATIKYFELLLPMATNDSVWIFDDIHWSADMEQAWEVIKKNPRVTVTIDTFQWGLVFFRKEQEKQDFVIRA